MATRRTRALAGIALGSAALLLASCAPGQLEGEATGEQEVQELAPEDLAGLTLQYLYFTDGPDEQATRDLIAEFEDRYDVTVELEVLPYADLVTSTLNRLSSGNPPDVVRLTSLTDFRDDLLVLDPYLGDDYRDEFLPGPVTGAVDAEGRLVAVPSDLTMNGPFVNLDLFEEAGVDVPDEWTWDELISAARDVKEATGVPYAFAMDKSGHRLSTVLSEYGTQLVDSGGNALDISRAEAALRPLVDMMADDDMPRDFWLGSGTRYEGANEIFLAGETPVYLSGNWQVGQFAQEASFDWAAAPNPCETECGGFPGGKYLAAFAAGDNPALAAEFIRFMNDAEHQEHFVSVSGQLPTRADLSSSGVTYTDETAQAAMDTFLADLAVTPEARFEANGNPAFSPSADALVEEISAVVDGQKELRPALEDLSARIDALVEETSS